MTAEEQRRAYRAASPAERVEMIRASYAKREAADLAAKRAAYERKHGEGSWDEMKARHAERLATWAHGPLMLAYDRLQDRYGFFEYGRGL